MLPSKGHSYVWFVINPAVDNSDSPSIVEQLSQGLSLVVIHLLVIVTSSLTYPMPYALFLASCSMGGHMLLFLLLTLHSPLLLCSHSQASRILIHLLPLGFCSPPFI